MDVRRIEEEVDPDFLSDAHSRTGPAESGDSCESKDPGCHSLCKLDQSEALVTFPFADMMLSTRIFVLRFVSNFMASQDARLSKFEADFKQQQSKMTNKIDTLLKAITDRMAGAIPSDTVKNLKLNTSLVSSVRSYLTIDPQCSSHPSTSINAVKTCSKEASHSQTSLL
ncbi:hypothetical protein Tco_0390420 [Tanacetum coccineum]